MQDLGQALRRFLHLPLARQMFVSGLPDPCAVILVHRLCRRPSPHIFPSVQSDAQWSGIA